MKIINNIVFDLGNVILDIDTNLSKTAFEVQGLKNFEQLYTLASQSAIFDKLETGALSENDFYNDFRKITQSNLSNNVIKNCWNALIKDYPSSNIDILKKARLHYKTFILSNTNVIHYNCYTEKLRLSRKISRLEDLVDRAYFSHEVKMRKPHSDIYRYVIDNSDLRYAETLFIDDSEENVKAAKKLGINCVWLNGFILEDIFNEDGTLDNDIMRLFY